VAAPALAPASAPSTLPTQTQTAPAPETPQTTAGTITTAATGPQASANAPDFQTRIKQMLSAAWLADLYPFTRDADISDEGYEAGLALALRCARMAPERRPAWDMVLLLADQVEGGTPDEARVAKRSPRSPSLIHLMMLCACHGLLTPLRRTQPPTRAFARTKQSLRRKIVRRWAHQPLRGWRTSWLPWKAASETLNCSPVGLPKR
jgi:hypothetical protein